MTAVDVSFPEDRSQSHRTKMIAAFRETIMKLKVKELINLLLYCCYAFVFVEFQSRLCYSSDISYWKFHIEED